MIEHKLPDMDRLELIQRQHTNCEGNPRCQVRFLLRLLSEAVAAKNLAMAIVRRTPNPQPPPSGRE